MKRYVGITREPWPGSRRFFGHEEFGRPRPERLSGQTARAMVAATGDEPGVRQRVGWLYEQLDHLKPLRRQAKQAMLEESRKYRGVELLRTPFPSWDRYGLR